VASHHVLVDAAEFGHRIRRARERKRWTQGELAAALGVGVRSVGRWERGEAVPRSAIGAIEQVLSLSFDGAEPDPREDAIRDLGEDRGGVLTRAEVEEYVARLYRRPAERAG